MAEQPAGPTSPLHSLASATSDVTQFLNATLALTALAKGPKILATTLQESWEKEATDATPPLHPPVGVAE
eukprot:5071146-Pyramimonas_sp.AAC.1